MRIILTVFVAEFPSKKRNLSMNTSLRLNVYWFSFLPTPRSFPKRAEFNSACSLINSSHSSSGTKLTSYKTFMKHLFFSLNYKIFQHFSEASDIITVHYIQSTEIFS